jgi:hypothetical protein
MWLVRLSRTLGGAALPLALAIAGHDAGAAQARIGALQDTTLYEDPAGALGNGAGEYLFAGRTGAGAIRRTLLAFDVAAQVPAGATIDRVELQLDMSRSVATGGGEVSVHRVSRIWGEGPSNAPGEEGGGALAQPGDATWLHAVSPGELWSTPGGDFVATASASRSVSGIGTYQWGGNGLVADVQSWLDDPSGNFGWVLLGDETAVPSAKRFNSAENLDEATRPLLIVDFTAVPIPPALALMAGGLLVLTGRVRRPRRAPATQGARPASAAPAR